MWIAMALHGGVQLASRPSAFDLLEAVFNDPTTGADTRRRVIDLADKPDFAWQDLAAEFGVTQDNLDCFTGQWDEPDVVIVGCINGIALADQLKTPIAFVPRIADTTSVDYSTGPAGVVVVVSAPELPVT